MGAKVSRAQDNQETEGKGDKLMSKKEMDNVVPSDMTAGQNMTEGNQQKSYSEVVTEGATRKTRVFVGNKYLFALDGNLVK